MQRSALLPIACLFSLAASAQTEKGGIYLTANDFSTGRIYYTCSSRGATSRVSDDDLKDSKHLVIDRAGSACRIDQKDIYAVRCGDGQVCRRFRDGWYSLSNAGEAILLYKVAIYPDSKGEVLKIKYYFSKNAVEPVEPLTVENLKLAFTDHRKFADALDVQFRSDNELYAYDRLRNCYKLNTVFNENK